MDGWQRISVNFNGIWAAGFSLKAVVVLPNGGRDMYFERLPTSNYPPGIVLMLARLAPNGVLTEVFGT